MTERLEFFKMLDGVFRKMDDPLNIKEIQLLFREYPHWKYLFLKYTRVVGKSNLFCIRLQRMYRILQEDSLWSAEQDIFYKKNIE